MASRPATVQDIHRIALSMPYAELYPDSEDNPIYQVGGKSFIFFRNPRPDALDPETGERLDDVIVFWSPRMRRQALLQIGRTLFHDAPFNATCHAVREIDIPNLNLDEPRARAGRLAQRASKKRAKDWLAEHHLSE